MKSSYNQIAGQSVERLAAISDGIFAVAMTLLVLDLHAPAREAIHSERDLGVALLALAPRLLVYMMSFLTLGIFWVGQQTQLNHLSRSSRKLTWMHLAFLFFVSITPFSTLLLAEFLVFRIALVLYWLNILALGVALYMSWNCALEWSLTKPDLSSEVVVAVKRRVVAAQSLYAAGALLCIFSTYASIATIIVVQLNYAFAPRWLNRQAELSGEKLSSR